MTRTTRGSSSLELTTTRIFRLLRPLRSHCTKFSDVYAKFQARGLSLPGWLPLESLLPPDRIGSRIHFDKDQVATLELSRAIYAVRDCFKHIVLNSKTSACTTSPSRISNLTTICAIIVGENIEANNDKRVSVEIEEREDKDVMSAIYDAMPHAYRRVTLLNHALDIILDTAPHHVTLLNAVLDLCLSHSLVHEARTTLLALIRLAIRSSSSTPPISHPSHSSFFLDLCERWKNAGQPESSFFHAFLEVLGEDWDPLLLGCKAIDRLARLMFRNHPPSFFRWLLYMLQPGLRCSLWSYNEPPLILDVRPIDTQVDWLLKWLTLTLEGVYSQHVKHWSLELSTYLASLIGWLLRNLPALEDRASALHGASISLATSWLGFAALAPSPVVSEVLSRVKSLVPRSNSYTLLIAIIQKQEDVASSLGLDAFHECLDRFAQRLQSYGLLSLEASLWGSALRVIEDPDDLPTFARSIGPDRLKNYQQQVMKLRDEAEERCYGQSACISSSETSRDGWTWEPLVDAWVPAATPRKRSPLVLRRSKVRLAQATPLLHTGSQTGKNDEGTAALSPGLVAVEVSPCPLRLGNCYFPPVKPFPLNPLKERSNFTSLLSDAISSRTVLHLKENISPVFVTPESRRHSATTLTFPSPTTNVSLSMIQRYQPADDVLDLFSYGTSSC